MNVVFFGIVLLAVLFALWNFAWAAMTGDMVAATAFPAAVGQAALDGSKTAVTLAIGLVGYMALFLGLMKVVEEAGGLKWMAGLIRPVLVRLFPDVPHDHPAMGAMVMNISANALGLGNAATPFGLKAMKELDALNKETGTATNAMVRFLAINTSGLALLPTGIIGLRALKESTDPAAIFPTTLFATGISTLIGIFAANSLARMRWFQPPEAQREADAATAEGNAGVVTAREMVPLLLFLAALVSLVVGVYLAGEAASAWIIPGLILGMLTVGMVCGVKIYEVFIQGAKEGFSLAVTIIPYLVAILAAVGMFRKSGGMDALVGTIGPATTAVGLPAEVLPLALLRPLSGSGAYGITAELIDTHGPDTYIGELASTMNGSTETTFYVLAVYFGSVGVSRIRHAVPAGLAADFAGVVASVIAVKLLLGG
ncbi:MAG TPA: spore maturation protein [Deltaproteobacteria bacterium]|nr:spore maturation protein [Deltaproteobacteria bacterium]